MRSFFLSVSLEVVSTGLTFAGTIDFTCPANNGTTSNGSQCNDVTTSLGQFIIQITDPSVIAVLNSSMPMGYDTTSHIFVSPLLFDSSTVVGRSAPISNGAGPVTVGVTNGGGTQLNGVGVPGTVPAGYPAGNNDEIRTAILNLNLTNGSGFAVTAGSEITTGPNVGVNSTGEVESTGCNSIATSTPIANCPGGSDFPANSFFDVFADVSIPGLGTFSNTSALVVQNSAITALPPVAIYTHGQSSSVGLFADGNFDAGLISQGDQLGTFVLTGHGQQHNKAAVSEQLFGMQLEDAVNSDSALNTEERTFIDGQIAADDTPEPSTLVLLFSGAAALFGVKAAAVTLSRPGLGSSCLS